MVINLGGLIRPRSISHARLHTPCLKNRLSQTHLGELPRIGYIGSVRTLFVVILTLLLAGVAAAQKTISFPTEDGGTIYADIYGEGDRAVVLAHGGRFNKESWENQARILASSGFR